MGQPIKLNFEGFEMQKRNVLMDIAQRVDEKNGVICLFMMLTHRVMVIRMSKMSQFFNFVLMITKNQSQFRQNV